MSRFTIWTVPGSPFARAVIAVMLEKRADFRVMALKPGDQRSPEHLTRHPFAKMPAFSDGDFELYETQAVLRYLDRALPDPQLTPNDAKAAARMDQVLNINDHYLFNGVSNVIGFQRVVGPLLLGLKPDEDAIAAAMPDAHRVLGELSRLLGDQDYFAGTLSLADFAIAGQLDFIAMAPEWEALTLDRPNLARWLDRMNERDSVRRSNMQAVTEMAQAA